MESESQELQPDLAPALLALGVAATTYALGLNTDLGRRFAKEYTWASVVAGNGLILLFLRYLIPRRHWNTVALAFAVAGLPMVMRSIINHKE